MIFQEYLKKLQDKDNILVMTTASLKLVGTVESVEEDYLVLLVEEKNYEDNKQISSYKLITIPFGNVAWVVE